MSNNSRRLGILCTLQRHRGTAFEIVRGRARVSTARLNGWNQIALHGGQIIVTAAIKKSEMYAAVVTSRALRHVRKSSASLY